MARKWVGDVERGDVSVLLLKWRERAELCMQYRQHLVSTSDRDFIESVHLQLKSDSPAATLSWKQSLRLGKIYRNLVWRLG